MCIASTVPGQVMVREREGGRERERERERFFYDNVVTTLGMGQYYRKGIVQVQRYFGQP